MYAFRNGTWRHVNIALSDPLFSEEHRREAAAIVATKMEKGVSLQASTAEAEKILYSKLFPRLVSGKQHGAPEN